MEIDDSARKHGVADDDIRHAILNPVGEVTDQRAPYFLMLIGEGRDGTLLEIGIYDPAGDPLIRHAMPLRHNWRRYVSREG